MEASTTPEQTDRLRPDADGPADASRLLGPERRGGGQRRHSVEPATDLWLRLLVEMLAVLTIEQDL